MMLLLADSPAAVEGISWVQVASSLGFAGLAWYVICYQMPKQADKFSADLAQARKEYSADLAEERKGRRDERANWALRLREQEAECLAERREFVAEMTRLRQSIEQARPDGHGH